MSTKFLGSAILLGSLLCVPIPSSALSCQFRVDFIMKCVEGFCTEGFLAFRRPTGQYCKTLLDVRGDEPILRIEEDLKGLGVGDFPPTGIYSVQLDNGHKPDRSSECLKADSQGFTKLESNRRCSFANLKLLEFPATDSIENVKASLVEQSERELLLDRARFWGFVLLVVGFSIAMWMFSMRRWWIIFVLPAVGLASPAIGLWNIYFTVAGGITLGTFGLWIVWFGLRWLVRWYRRFGSGRASGSGS